MRLAFSRVNQAYVFFFYDQPCPMGDHGLIFNERADAVAAANDQGLIVNDDGSVVSVEEIIQEVIA
jgi:hypothetical protein